MEEIQYYSCSKKARNWSLIIIIDQWLLYWIVRKSFKKLLLNSISKFLANNTFLSSYQSQFRPSDFYEYQLLIVHVEVRGIFLHMSKGVNQTPIFRKIGLPLKCIESFLKKWISKSPVKWSVIFMVFADDTFVAFFSRLWYQFVIGATKWWLNQDAHLCISIEDVIQYWSN